MDSIQLMDIIIEVIKAVGAIVPAVLNFIKFYKDHHKDDK